MRPLRADCWFDAYDFARKLALPSRSATTPQGKGSFLPQPEAFERKLTRLAYNGRPLWTDIQPPALGRRACRARRLRPRPLGSTTGVLAGAFSRSR